MIDLDWNFIKVAFLNDCFREIDYLSADKLKHKFKEMYISFREMRHPEYGIKPHNAELSEKFAKEGLRDLMNKEYFEVKKVNESGFDEAMCYPTQKLFDEDPLPVGGIKKQLKN